MHFLRDHHPARRGEDRRAGLGLEVQPGVQRRMAGERVDAPAEGRTQCAPVTGCCVGSIIVC